MRNGLLLLLVLAAAAGVWMLYDGGGTLDPEAPFDPAADGAGPDDEGGGMRTVEAAPVVAVWGADAGAALPRMDHARAMETLLRFDTAADGLSGADWLAAVETHAGRSMPVRFTSQAGLERFRALRLLDEAPPASIDVPASLEWFRPHGFVVETHDTFLLIRPQRRP